MTQTHMLPARLDSSGAPALLTSLLQQRGTAVELDASGVEVCGALSLEVLIAAGRQWQADGKELKIIGASSRFSSVCKTLGLSPARPWVAIQPDAVGAA